MVFLTSGHLVPDGETSYQNYFLQIHNETASEALRGVVQGVLREARAWQHRYALLDPTQDHHGTTAIKEAETKFFEEEDLDSWIIFTVVFFLLIFFDNFVLHRKAEKLSLLQAFLYTTFWISCAGAFNIYVYYSRGLEDAFSWGTGYILEWMLSIDNLFVFHQIFKAFHTPDEQKHKPLFYGIMGAIVFRMIFFLVGEWLMHHFTWVHIVFGMFLVYTGIKAVAITEEEEEAPEDGQLFKFLVKYINYVDDYDDDGNFFMPVYVNKETNSFVGKEALQGDDGGIDVKYRATKLVVVVVCLEVTDLLFAVDSVSAIVAQIPDLFLAYTACVFAMLGLRALFFAIDELVNMFSLLGYGVAAILVFLGFKLIFKSWFHIPPGIVCIILISTLVLSILASIIKERIYPSPVEDAPEDTRAPSAH